MKAATRVQSSVCRKRERSKTVANPEFTKIFEIVRFDITFTFSVDCVEKNSQQLRRSELSRD
jgi:hypothetical protein